MYRLVEIEEWIGIIPPNPNEDLNQIILNELRERLEGSIDPDIGLILAVLQAKVVSDGVILPLPGDPRTFYQARYVVITFKPILLEVVRGIVKDARQPGLFISLGPIDGFIHKSQIMDEPVEYLPERRGFRGVNSGRIVELRDIVRARIVQISKPRRGANLRVALTMRQPYLGKETWIRRETSS